MKARWLFDLTVTSLGLFVVAACATGSSQIGTGEGGEGGEWSGGNSSSSSSGKGGAGGGGGGSSGGAGGGASSSSSASSSASSSGQCLETPCKLVNPQCGCAAGEMCQIDGTTSGAKECVAAGNVAIGAACTGADCSPGSICVNTTPVIDTCVKYCNTDTDCTAPGGLCLITLNDGSSGNIPGVTLCTENCDPATNIGCPVAGTGCQMAQESMGQMRLLTRCTEAGSGTQGASCTDNGDCATTYGCFNAGTTQCLKYCKVGGAACPGGLICSSLGTIGSTEYGVCY
jgi:hypothetical protein